MSRVSSLLGDFPAELTRAHLIGRPAVCSGVRCCPLVRVSCRSLKFHEPDTHDLLRTSSRGCHEETASVQFKLNDATDASGG